MLIVTQLVWINGERFNYLTLVYTYEDCTIFRKHPNHVHSKNMITMLYLFDVKLSGTFATMRVLIISIFVLFLLTAATPICSLSETNVYFESKLHSHRAQNMYRSRVYTQICVFNTQYELMCLSLYTLPCHHVLYSRFRIYTKLRSMQRSLTQEYGSGLLSCGRSRMKNQWVFSNHNSWTPEYICMYTFFYDLDIYFIVWGYIV